MIFQAIETHHVEHSLCASEESQLEEIIHYLSALMYVPNFLIRPITITLIFSFPILWNSVWF